MSFFWRQLKHGWHLVLHPDHELWHAIGVTLNLAFFATLIALALGLPLAVALGLGRGPLRRFGMGLANAGMGLPPVLVGLLLSLLMYPAAPLGGLDWLYTKRGMVFAQTVLSLPLVVAFAGASIQAVPRGLIDQARVLGAGRARIAALVLREARIGVLAAALAAAGSAFSEVGAMVLVGGNAPSQTATLATEALHKVSAGDFGQAIGIGFLILGIFLLITSLATVLSVREGRLMTPRVS